MSRSQQNQIFNTATANSKQDQSNAQTAFTGAQDALTGFNSRLAAYDAADPYTAGGQFAKDQSEINASRANATSASVQDTLNRAGGRSGENTAGYGSNVTAATEKATLDQGTAQAQSDAERIGDETKYQQFGVQASEFPVTAEDQEYATSVGGSNSALGVGENAAKTPGVWDSLFQDALEGSQTGARIAGAGGYGGRSG